jgi:ABC-type sulfate transport system permease subunit
MSIRAWISFLVAMMVNAVVFGVGAIAVLAIPQLNADAWFWLPLVIAASFLISPFIAWQIAPMLRSRWQREHNRQAV